MSLTGWVRGDLSQAAGTSAGSLPRRQHTAGGLHTPSRPLNISAHNSVARSHTASFSRLRFLLFLHNHAAVPLTVPASSQGLPGPAGRSPGASTQSPLGRPRHLESSIWPPLVQPEPPTRKPLPTPVTLGTEEQNLHCWDELQG